MGRSVIVAVIILILIVTASRISMKYTETTANEFTERLDKAGADAGELKAICEDWEEKKIPLMLIIDHRDIEEVSLSLIRACHEAENGRAHMAKQETDIAKFLIRELVERERLSVENIM